MANFRQKVGKGLILSSVVPAGLFPGCDGYNAVGGFVAIDGLPNFLREHSDRCDNSRIENLRHLTSDYIAIDDVSFSVRLAEREGCDGAFDQGAWDADWPVVGIRVDTGRLLPGYIG